MIRLFWSQEKPSRVKIIIDNKELTKRKENGTNIYFHI